VKAEFAKVYGAAAADAQDSFTQLFDAAAKNVPAGSENGLALWKSAIATAGGAFESMQKGGATSHRHRGSQLHAVTTQAVKTAGKAKRS
jgi:hypothetical protein